MWDKFIQNFSKVWLNTLVLGLTKYTFRQLIIPLNFLFYLFLF